MIASVGVKPVAFDAKSGNIYLFGDSFNDPGQFHYVREGLALDNLDVPLQSQDGLRQKTIHIRGRSGCASNGSVQADFVAQRLHMLAIAGFALEQLPKGGGNLVNFALSGAAHYNNSVIFFSEEKPAPSFDVTYQIQKAKKLGCQMDKRDVCIIQVSYNDIFLIYQTSQGHLGNWPKEPSADELERQYVTAALENIDSLYSIGCRRIMLPILTNISTLETPNWKKVDAITPGILADMDGRLGRMQQSLKASIAQKVDEKWHDLAVELLDATSWWQEVQEKMDITSTLTDAGWSAADEIKNEKKHFFFDDTHPTQEAHKKLAKRLVEHI